MAHDPQSLLRLHSAARGLCEDEIREISQFVKIRTHQPGDVVIEPGAIPKTVSLVIGGRFRMTSDVDSNDRLVNRRKGKGVLFSFDDRMRSELVTWRLYRLDFRFFSWTTARAYCGPYTSSLACLIDPLIAAVRATARRTQVD